MVYLAPRRFAVREHTILTSSALVAAIHYIRVLDTGLFQWGDGSSIAVDAHDIQRFCGVTERILVGVDDGDIMVFPGKLLGQSIANFSIAYDDDFQVVSSFPGNCGSVSQLMLVIRV